MLSNCCHEGFSPYKNPVFMRLSEFHNYLFAFRMKGVFENSLDYSKSEVLEQVYG